MLDLDVAGYATVTEHGIDFTKAPEGVRFEPLPEDFEKLYSLVGWTEKFAAHNAAMWKNGLLVVVPKGVVLEKPLYVRIAVTGQTFWRHGRRRRGRRARLDHRGVRVAERGHRGVLERGDRALRRAEREARVRLAAEPLEADVALRDASRARRARRRARLGRRRLRLEARQDAHPERPERPRRDLAGHRRVLRRRRPAPRLRHVPGAHRAELRERLRLQGRAARQRDRRLARDDPRRAGGAEDERVPGVPQPDALADGARGADPGPRDHGERRALHARRDGQPRRPRAALLPDDARPAACRGRAA